MTEKIRQEDLVELYDDLTRQLQEDREKVTKLYDDLKLLVSTKEEYAVNGLVLSKIMEIQIKQTAQLIELARINQSKDKDKQEDTLSPEDKEKLFEDIKDLKKI